ncbi:RNA polymerase sigma factor [Paenibacillus mesophilus]|uniref:RNA polymerase sigma factor n=1 Tax=Paenibacillus mesophilus TaxID=2582849 RepID=UPI00110F1A30|nr:RNA polymerase sigma factor [Paenibacillus mesophilus]TMV46612.1 RNA polymerase sigma factor [Paenibacillus mesophilus]
METDTRDQFEKLIAPFRSDLLRYCRKLAAADWDSDDLFQEAMLNMYKRYKRWPDRDITRPYLYRVAVHAWYDICRSRQSVVRHERLAEESAPSYSEWSRFDARDSLESLMDALEPRQAALILLVDVFRFTVGETSEMLKQPLTAVKAALHRARIRLKKAADRSIHQFGDVAATGPRDNRGGANPELLDTFVKAFRETDATAIIHAYRGLIACGVSVESAVRFRNKVWFYFRDAEGNMLMITSGSGMKSVE